MADQKFFDGTPITSIPDDHNIGVREPNATTPGSKVISWANLKILLNSVLNFIPKVGGAVAGNVAIFDGAGNVVDSGKKLVYDLGFFISDEETPVTTDNKGHQYAERALTISSIALTAQTAPTGSALVVNVLKNGVTILTSNISLPAGSNRVSITSPQISSLSIAVGDRMSAEVISPGLTIAGAGVSITIVSELT